jgi:hypothetical protein
VQLQNAKQRFEAQGLKLAAISYDSPAILKDFAQRHKIEFPLLADPNSEIIRTFNVLNTAAKGMTKGMAYPGFFYVDANGVIREKFFTPKYTDRLTANNVISKLFPELSAEVTQDIKAPHLQLTLAQSDRSVIPGGRFSLIAESSSLRMCTSIPPKCKVISRFNSPCRGSQGSNSSLSFTGTLKCCTWRPPRSTSRFSKESFGSARILR